MLDVMCYVDCWLLASGALSTLKAAASENCVLVAGCGVCSWEEMQCHEGGGAEIR